MWVICRITNVMPNNTFATIEHIISTASDVDGIDEAVFTESVSKVPKGFFVAGSDKVELVIDSADSSTFHLAMQEETAGDGAVADEDELTEEGAATLLNKVLDFLASGDADNAVIA